MWSSSWRNLIRNLKDLWLLIAVFGISDTLRRCWDLFWNSRGDTCEITVRRTIWEAADISLLYIGERTETLKRKFDYKSTRHKQTNKKSFWIKMPRGLEKEGMSVWDTRQTQTHTRRGNRKTLICTWAPYEQWLINLFCVKHRKHIVHFTDGLIIHENKPNTI